jgi:hypothetical protein
MNAHYEALRSDPEAWEEHVRERELWDATLADGLEFKIQNATERAPQVAASSTPGSSSTGSTRSAGSCGRPASRRRRRR